MEECMTRLFKHRFKVVAIPVAALLLAVLGAVAPASANSSSTDVAQNLKTVHLADGAIATVQTFTGSQIAKLPALPKGRHYAASVTVAHITLPKGFRSADTSQAPSAAHPDSASGCTPYGGTVVPYTCITVTGSGLDEEAWYTGTYIANPNATAYYEANGLVMLYDVWENLPFGQYFADIPGYGPATWANGTKLCNWWSGSAAGTAMPCITINS
jgi:hypothetical protein